MHRDSGKLTLLQNLLNDKHKTVLEGSPLVLIAGNDAVTHLKEATWIGLQVGAPHNVTYTNGTAGVVIGHENVTGCYWPAGVRPRLAKDDPCPANAVDECSVPYNDTFHGQWEDGMMYKETELADFWAPGEPDGDWISRCYYKVPKEDGQSRVSQGQSLEHLGPISVFWAGFAGPCPTRAWTSAGPGPWTRCLPH